MTHHSASGKATGLTAVGLALSLLGCGGSGSDDSLFINTRDVSFDIAGQVVGENAGTFEITILVSETLAEDIEIPFSVTGSAQATLDYLVAASPVVIPANRPSVELELTIVNDVLDEGAEMIQITLGTPDNAGLGGQKTHTVEVEDNDLSPSVQFAAPTLLLDEASGTALVMVEIDAVSGLDVTVPYGIGGSASVAGDFTVAASPLVIPAGQTSAGIALTVVDDVLLETTETIELTLGLPINAVLGATTLHTTSVSDNDSAPTVAFSVPAQDGDEDSGAIVATVELSSVSGLDVTVPFTLGGTAVQGVDYTVVPAPLFIPSGQFSADITITFLDDGLDEAGESIEIALGPPTNANLGAGFMHTTTIVDDDPAPAVEFSSAAQSVAEAGGQATVTVELSEVSGQQVMVPLNVMGTARSPADFDLGALPLVIPAGQLSVNLPVTLVPDPIDEFVETIELQISAPVNAVLGGTTLHVLSIQDDDPQPSVRMQAANQMAGESDGMVSFTVELSQASGKGVTVPYSVRGSASPGSDYSIAAGPLVLSPGQASADVTVNLVGDALLEASETVVVSLGPPTNATLGAGTTHTLTIVDDDTAPTVQFSAAVQSVSEGGGSTQATVALSAPSGVPVTVPFSVRGSALRPDDYSLSVSSPLTIPAGQLSATIPVVLVSDSLDEANEIVVLTLGPPTNGNLGVQAVHTLTIADDDAAPSVQFTTAAQTAGEGAGATSATIQLSALSGQEVTVPYAARGTATNPDDFTIGAGPIVIPAGQLSVPLGVTVVSDTLDEFPETVLLTLGVPTNASLGATNQHMLTIQDDDPVTRVLFSSASQAVGEGAGAVAVQVQLLVPSGKDVSVPFTLAGTAGAPADYTVSASPVVIPAGQMSTNIVVTVADDLVNETSETVRMTLGMPANAILGAITVHTLTINDNDAQPTLEFTAAAQSASEGAGGVFASVQMTAVSAQPVSVPYTVAGTANDPNDYTIDASPLVIPAGQLSGTIAVTLAADALDEMSETVRITLGPPANANLGATTVHTLTVLDDDAPPSIQFTAAAQGSGEAVGGVTATLQLSAVSGQDVSVPYAVTGTARTPADFGISAGPAVILAGQMSTNVAITVVDDALDEVPETVILTLGAPANATLGAVSVHTLTVGDNDLPPTVAFAAGAQAAGEGAGGVPVTVQLSAVSGKDITLPFTSAGSAGSPGDFSTSPTPLVILAGQAAGAVVVTLVDDLLNEVDETVQLTLGVPTNATLGGTTVHTLTITDNDAQPTLEFTAAAQGVSEGAGSATATVQLTATSAQPVTVPFTVTGTAGNPSDYTVSASPLVIPAGQLSAPVTVTLAADALDEFAETVVITLGAPANANLGAQAVHTLTINDDDMQPSVELAAAAQSVGEAAAGATVAVQLSTVSGKDVSVPYSIRGSASTPADFTVGAGPVLIPAGQLSTNVAFTVAGDSLDEFNETVELTLGNATNASLGATTQHTLTITDDDPVPVVDFAAAAQGAFEGDGVVLVNVQLSAPSGKPVQVPFSVAGPAANPGDATVSASPLLFAAGQTSLDVAVTLVDDLVNEPNEALTITLGAPVNGALGATTVHTLTVSDDDLLPTVQFTAPSQNAGEGTGVALATVQISAVSAQPVTVPYTVRGTATSPADYSIAAGPLVIPAGQLSADIAVALVADPLDEASETVVINLGVPTNANLGGTSQHTLSITDDDPAPVVQFTSAGQAAGEAAGSAAATVQLSVVSGQDVSVPYTARGSATSPADFSVGAGPVVIPAGQLSANITVALVSDTLDEFAETVVLSLGAPANATLGGTAVHTLSITDDDAQPSVAFSAPSQSAGEGTGSAQATLALSSASGKPVSVPFSVAGTASNPADFSVSASPVQIPVGQTSVNVVVTLVGDLLNEPDETVQLTIGTPANATQGATTVHTLTITDDDSQPTVQFALASQTVGEAAGSATVTVQLSAASALPVTVPFSLRGTAATPDDFTAGAGPVVIPAGQLSSNVPVTIVSDALDELSETVVLTLGAPINATLGGTSVHTLTITDDDAQPTVAFTSASQSVGEAIGGTTATVQLSTPSGLDVTVPFTIAGTAASPADFSVSPSPVVILAGQTAVNVTITIVPDALDELSETVALTLGAPANGSLGAPILHTLTITDDDAPPTVAFTSAAQSVGEAAGGGAATVQLSAASGLDVSVPFTVAGTAANPDDFGVAAGPVLIPAGQLSTNVALTIVSDTLDEPNETVELTLGGPTNATLGAPTVHTLSITDDDATPTVAFTGPSQGVGEAGVSATATVQLSAVSGFEVTVPYTVGGTATATDDYGVAASPVVIPAGQISQTVTVTVVSDTLDEPNEMVVLTLGGPTNASLGAPTVHTITITDDDAAPTVAFTGASQSVGEAGVSATAIVQLSALSGFAVTVPYTVGGTASDPADYGVAASRVVIPAGQISQTIPVTVVSDTLDEPNETVVLTLGGPTNASLGAPTVHTLTITDDDAPVTVAFTAAAQGLDESFGTALATLQLSALSGYDVTVPYTVSGTATNPADYTVTASPLVILAGQLSADVSIGIVDDPDDELDETVILTLGALTNGTPGVTTVHTLTILDNDPPAPEASPDGGPSVEPPTASLAIGGTLELRAAGAEAVRWTVDDPRAGAFLDTGSATSIGGSARFVAGPWPGTVRVTATRVDTEVATSVAIRITPLEYQARTLARLPGEREVLAADVLALDAGWTLAHTLADARSELCGRTWGSSGTLHWASLEADDDRLPLVRSLTAGAGGRLQVELEGGRGDLRQLAFDDALRPLPATEGWLDADAAPGPSSVDRRAVHSVAGAPDGATVIATAHELLRLDVGGALLPFAVRPALPEIHRACVDAEGRIYVAVQDQIEPAFGSVRVLSALGQEVARIDAYRLAPDTTRPVERPLAVSVDPRGRLLVYDDVAAETAILFELEPNATGTEAQALVVEPASAFLDTGEERTFRARVPDGTRLRWTTGTGHFLDTGESTSSANPVQLVAGTDAGVFDLRVRVDPADGDPRDVPEPVLLFVIDRGERDHDAGQAAPR